MRNRYVHHVPQFSKTVKQLVRMPITSYKHVQHTTANGNKVLYVLYLLGTCQKVEYMLTESELNQKYTWKVWVWKSAEQKMTAATNVYNLNRIK